MEILTYSNPEGKHFEPPKYGGLDILHPEKVLTQTKVVRGPSGEERRTFLYFRFKVDTEKLWKAIAEGGALLENLLYYQRRVTLVYSQPANLDKPNPASVYSPDLPLAEHRPPNEEVLRAIGFVISNPFGEYYNTPLAELLQQHSQLELDLLSTFMPTLAYWNNLNYLRENGILPDNIENITEFLEILAARCTEATLEYINSFPTRSTDVKTVLPFPTYPDAVYVVEFFPPMLIGLHVFAQNLPNYIPRGKRYDIAPFKGLNQNLQKLLTQSVEAKAYLSPESVNTALNSMQEMLPKIDEALRKNLPSLDKRTSFRPSPGKINTFESILEEIRRHGGRAPKKPTLYRVEEAIKKRE